MFIETKVPIMINISKYYQKINLISTDAIMIK